MKKLLITLFVLSSLFCYSQDYNSKHSYDMFSNIECFALAQYTNSLSNKVGDWGANLLLTKQEYSFFKLRALVNVNGFIKKPGFDRRGEVLLGGSFNFAPFYIFLDGGYSYNPSSKQKLNPVGESGVGFNFDIGRGMRLLTEAGIDCIIQNNKYYSSLFVRFGYGFTFGITSNDKQEIQIENNKSKLLIDLKDENSSLKKVAKEQESVLTEYQSQLDKNNKLMEALQKKLDDCNDKVVTITTSQIMQPIYFEFASSELSPLQQENVADIADIINSDNHTYSIEGYCSNNGSPYKNQILSEARADVVYRELIYNGVDKNRLFVIGYGMTDVDSPREQKVIIKRLE